jgi:holin-like protein
MKKLKCYSYLGDTIMKILRQLLLIIGIFLIGEILSKTLKLPLPGNIIGMLLLLFLLMTKIVKLEMIEEVSDFFLKHLAFFFIPAGVSLMAKFGLIKDSIWQILLICIVVTLAVIAVTGLTVQSTAALQDYYGRSEKKSFNFFKKRSSKKSEDDNGSDN